MANEAVVAPVKVKAGATVVDRAAAQAVVEAETVRIEESKEEVVMPGFDRSGPIGAGPMTGGRRGLCGNRAGLANMPAYGGGYGRGMGVGFRHGYGRERGRGFGPTYSGYPSLSAYGTGYPLSKTDEIEMLRADAEAMQKSLEAVQQRIAELDKEETR